MSAAYLALALLSALAFLDGANNAANFVSMAVGSRALPLRRALFYAMVADFVGAIIGGRLYLVLLERIGGSQAGGSPSAALVGLMTGLAWVLYATFSRAVVPISVALLSASLAALAEEVTAYVFSLLALFCLWLAQIGAAALLAGLLLRVGGRDPRDRGTRTLRASTLVLPFALLLALALRGDAAVRIAVAIFCALLAFIVLVGGQGLVVPLSLAALFHGLNDVALMMVLLRLAAPGVGGAEWVSALLGSSLASGILLWGHRVAVHLAESVTMLELDVAHAIYTTVFTVMAASLLFGFPAPITYSVLGAFAGLGLGRGLGAINTRALAKVMAFSLATFLAVMVPSALARLLQLL